MCRSKSGHYVARMLALTMMLGLLPEIAASRETTRADPRLKIAYLINFARFIYWPAAEAGTALQICIINGNAYRDLVTELKPGSVQQRDVSMIVLSLSDELPESCDMIFISDGYRKEWERILDRVKGRAVLTVGEEDDFIASGGIMRFYYENEKLRFAADPVRAKASGVQISARLLDLAKIESSLN